MVSNSFDQKNSFKVELQAHSFSPSDLYKSFVSPGAAHARKLMDETPLASVHDDHLRILEEAISYSHDDVFLSRVLLFSLRLEDEQQSKQIIGSVRDVNRKIVDDFFYTVAQPDRLHDLVDTPGFPVFLEMIQDTTLREFNSLLNSTLLLGSADGSQANRLLDASLEAVEKLVAVNKISKELLYTVIFAEYDLGETHDKAEQMFDVFQDFDRRAAFSGM